MQDGLITLYMEANNVEEYLKSARQTRLDHKPSIRSTRDDPFDPSSDHTLTGEESVLNGDELGTQMEELSMQQTRPRRPVYQPCTIPQQRDRTRPQGEELEDDKPSPSELSSEVSGYVIRVAGV